MISTVIYDANVLYPNVLRDVLIRVAQHGLVRAHWTERILDEVFVNLHMNRPDLGRAKLDRTRALMNESIRDVLVEDYEPLEAIVTLPDVNDRHVLAAAIQAKAQTIVTANVRHFPETELSPWGIDARHPGSFLVEQLRCDQTTMRLIIRQIASATTNPPLSVDDVLDQLTRCGAYEVANLLRT